MLPAAKKNPENSLETAELRRRAEAQPEPCRGGASPDGVGYPVLVNSLMRSFLIEVSHIFLDHTL